MHKPHGWIGVGESGTCRSSRFQRSQECPNISTGLRVPFKQILTPGSVDQIYANNGEMYHEEEEHT